MAIIAYASQEDSIARLGLDHMPNVTIANNGSWLESDTTGEDD